MGIKIIFGFEDAEGHWTREKRQTATDEIKGRCYRLDSEANWRLCFPLQRHSLMPMASGQVAEPCFVTPPSPKSRRLLKSVDCK